MIKKLKSLCMIMFLSVFAVTSCITFMPNGVQAVYAAIDTSGTASVTTPIIQNITTTGYYSVILKGGPGRSEEDGSYRGGFGGQVEAVLRLNAGDTVTITGYKGGVKRPNVSSPTQSGGNAVSLSVNGTIILGAAGGGGAGASSNGTGETGQSVTATETVLSRFSAGGGGGFGGNSGGDTGSSGACPAGCIAATGGYGKTNRGYTGLAGYNFYMGGSPYIYRVYSNIQIPSLVGDTGGDNNARYSIKEQQTLPTSVGSSVTISVSDVLVSQIPGRYKITMYAAGGDVISGVTALSAGQFFSTRIFGNSIGLARNTELDSMIAAHTGGTLGSSAPTIWASAYSEAGALTNSYVNGGVITSATYDAVTKPGYIYCNIQLLENLTESVSTVSTVINKTFNYNTSLATVLASLPSGVNIVSTKSLSYSVGVSSWACSNFSPTTSGNYTFYGTLNPATFTGYLDNVNGVQATATITISPANTISSVTQRTVTVPYKTTQADLLTAIGIKCNVTMSQTGPTDLNVTAWDLTGYNNVYTGSQVVYGTFGSLPSEYYNLGNVKPYVTVIVSPPTNVDVLNEVEELRIPHLAVLQGKPFSMYVSRYLTMDGGSSNGVTVTNTDKLDGFIIVSGALSTTGYTEITINGSKFIFNVIQEPNSSNVVVLFN